MFKKNKVDEREQMEMYKIEHYAFWIMYWALFASIFIQMIAFDGPFKIILGEWIVFLLTSVGISIAYGKKGHYDYHSKPGIKSSLIYSASATVIFDILSGIYLYTNHHYYNLAGFALTIVFQTILIFTLTFVTLFFVGKLVKKRKNQLADEYTEE